MSKGDKLLQAVEAVHAASLDEAFWPAALQAVTNVVGGVGTTFEAVDKSSMQLTDFWSHGIPPGSELKYVDHFISISPRTELGFNHPSCNIGYDYMLLNEAAINLDPYYSDFLAGADLRYFVSATLTRTRQEFSCVAVQRSRRQGHVGEGEIALMRQLLPHLRQAFDMTRRLRGSGAAARAFEHTLDWLADGAALIRRDGTVMYANESLRAIARRDEGIRIGKRGIEFASADTNARYAQAVASACRLLNGELRAADRSDFPAPRRSGNPRFLVSVRPLIRTLREAREAPHADAVVFIRDPLHRHASTIGVLRDMFGLTEAEAGLARALQAGVSLAVYARESRLSLNTVYTHLRRIKEKTHTRRQPELIQKLKDLEIPVHSTER